MLNLDPQKLNNQINEKGVEKYYHGTHSQGRVIVQDPNAILLIFHDEM